MSSNPINQGLRFILEILALVAMGIWGWQKGYGWISLVLAIGIPLVVAILWGVFRIPNDPGKAIVATPGIIRLVFELLVFGFAVWSLFNLQKTTLGLILGITIFLHYVISYDRIFWMLKR
mgnify:CR=1 FL=1